MELKSYQKKVIADLTRYLELLNETKNYEAAFRFFWQEKSTPTLGYYQDILPGVPNLCFKVPTGGGKTFIACNAIRPIFDALPVTKTKARSLGRNPGADGESPQRHTTSLPSEN